MKAIVIVSGVPEDVTLAEQYTTPMLPLVDRPFLQHVVEYLVEGGITTIDFVVSHLPDKVELLLGDGTRWGSKFRFHLAADDTGLYSSLRRLAHGEQTILLAHADRLPQVDIAILGAQSNSQTTVLVTDSEGKWTGWAALPSPILAAAPEITDEATTETWLCGLNPFRKLEVPQNLEVRSFAGLLQAQKAVACDAFPSLLQSGRPVAALPGERGASTDRVRLGRGVVVHPTAKLIEPVFIGENSRIGEGASIGPNVVIGENVLVGEQTIIRDALLLPGTYVGDGLELTEIVAERGRVWSVRHGDAVSVPDAFLVGDLNTNHVTDMAAETQSRLIAFFLLLVFWPLLLLTTLGLALFRRGGLVHRHTFVALPTTLDSRDWRTKTYSTLHANPAQLRGISHFLLHVLPGLFAVCSGTIRLIGVRPRLPEEIEALPADFKGTYARSRAGLIVDMLPVVDDVPAELQYTAEAFYAATASAKTDLTVLGNYLQSAWGRGDSGFRQSKVSH